MTAHNDQAECPSASMTVGKPPLPLTILPFSPGPFSNRESEVVDLDGQPVAIVHKEDPAVRQADAQLLAASWDLFVALREYVLADQCAHAPDREEVAARLEEEFEDSQTPAVPLMQSRSHSSFIPSTQTSGSRTPIRARPVYPPASSLYCHPEQSFWRCSPRMVV